MSGWSVAALGDLCSIELGATPPRGSSRYWDAEKSTSNVWLSIADLPTTLQPAVSDSKEYLSDEGAARGKIVREGTLLVSFKLTLGRLAFAGCDLRTNEAIAALSIRDARRIEKEYLYWCLTYFDWQKAAEGEDKVKGKTLNKEKLKALPVLVPPLEEQRRIVAVLDEAFAAIATAAANAEKNLANAQELFKSNVSLALKPGADGLQKMSFGSFCQLQRGFDLPTKDRREGSVPLVGSSGVIDSVDRSMVVGPGVITGRSGSIGNVFFQPEGFWPLNTTLYVKNFFGNAPRFVYHFLRAFDLSRFATGSGVPTLNRNFVNDASIWVPDTAMQQKLADAFDELEDEAQRVSRVYQAKIENLECLKQSILHRAFSGELTQRDLVSA